jgi:hypothetical protein
MSVAGSATEQISKHLQYASQPPFTVLIQIPKNIEMNDKFRGRKLFVTNCATEHSHYLILTTVTSISLKGELPFTFQRTRSRRETNFVAKNLLSETLPRGYQNINISFAIHLKQISITFSTDVSTFIRDTFTQHRNTQPNRNFPFNTFQSTILSSNPNLTQSPPEP